MNELSQSHSPYLLQHKDNPVQWKLWTAETLRLAKVLNKPILVSVGYSTCHWCHVMAHESFEDIDIAAIMNEFFICIKVDREERPDIDQYMMNAVQLLGVSGGWPLNVFLTPDLKPFYGGTYFPSVRKYGRISWPELLIAIHKAFIQRPKELELQGQKLVESLAPKSNENKTEVLESIHFKNLLIDAANGLVAIMDGEFGGFGFGQKFPNTFALEFLLRNRNLYDGHTAINHVHLSMRKMCLGGMFDHLAGGFCRYTTDRAWKVPHFEKMAYDHALILQLLAKVNQDYKEYGYSYFIHKSLHFWEQEMQSSSGLFYAAMDADSEGQEGKYYVWTDSEIERCLGDEYKNVRPYLELEPMPHGEESVLLLKEEKLTKEGKISEETLRDLDAAFSRMKSWRSLRTKPSLDTKLILGWNSLIAKTYGKIYISSQNNNYRLKSIDLVERLWENFRIGGEENKFYRYKSGEIGVGLAFLEDLAYLMDALLCAHQISFNAVYLSRIEKIFILLDQEFRDESGFYNLHSENHVDSLSQGVDLYDHSTPNPNAVVAAVSWAMYQITEQHEYRLRAESMLKKALVRIKGSHFSTMNWIELSQQIYGNQLIVKCRNVDSVYLYLNGHVNDGFIVCEDQSMDEEELQFCTNQMCFAKVKGQNEIKEALGQLKADNR
ncbi:MAG: thioredoxin domain-containing protein [Saprospiraceae bacterium]|nr:thioredoxin domain-containing protein [Saprospiraceae bacterium]HRG32261.1 thioredoxin domain-containing protein [Saprospiraceae bacterium]